MNNTVRIALAVAYAAVGIWALMPTPPKPLAAATSPPPAWERPRYERPVPAPRPRRPEDTVQPDEFRGSADDDAKPMPAALHPEPVRKPSVEMTTADLWALANLKFKELPPIEYDYLPDTIVTIEDVATEAELRKRCNWKDTAKTIVGCAGVFEHVCHILLGPRPDWAGLTRNIVIRHEMGHCNGWGSDHAGIR
jgi:hypothetical protein